MFERLTLWDDANKCWVEDHSRDTREWKNGHNACMNRLAEYEDSGLSPEEVQELAKAKAEERLVVLPCKAEDTIWKIKAVFSYFSKPIEDRVERIIISSNEILVCCTSGTKFSVNSIGKTVFLSREEAEKALEGLETRKQRGY
jgi:hypothetical protein